ncbi:RHS repeat-associated core domain-containing protein [Pseudomonas sp. NPDC007930]|uniref:RHS repeat-associated core domain-containing protein n=1 Tax=Pseudomonas sp. NPDC007930 TaxID=3364417 RepID=UPI0036EAB1ED
MLTMGDHKQTVLIGLNAGATRHRHYGPYGDTAGAATQGQSGYNGYWTERNGLQLLGHGRRAYQPSINRFNQPDPASPFGPGGMNAYAYCAAEPINQADPSGMIKIPSLAALATRALLDAGVPQHRWLAGRLGLIKEVAHGRARALFHEGADAMFMGDIWRSVSPHTLERVPITDLPRIATEADITAVFREHTRSYGSIDDRYTQSVRALLRRYSLRIPDSVPPDHLDRLILDNALFGDLGRGPRVKSTARALNAAIRLQHYVPVPPPTAVAPTAARKPNSHRAKSWLFSDAPWLSGPWHR